VELISAEISTLLRTLNLLEKLRMAAETLPLPVYTPNDPDEKNIEKFRRRINETRGLNLKDYSDLHAYSVSPATFQQFWQDVWDYTGIKASKQSKDVVPFYSVTHAGDSTE
jgi:hypothetical protein